MGDLEVAQSFSALRTVVRAAVLIGALWLFVLALQLIKTGAGGLRPLF